MNGNGDQEPDVVQPLPEACEVSPIPPYVDSVYNMIVRRIRAAKTIFEDRVKLVLRQVEEEHWSFLKKPYLLVVPTQTRQPRNVEVDFMSWVDPRQVTFVAQFDGCSSEEEHLAANAIDTAEAQLIFILANWRPRTNFEPSQYGGCRIQGTRMPDVKVHYIFTFLEQIVLPDDAPIFPGDECVAEPVELDHINLHVSAPGCLCVPDVPGPRITVTSGCRVNPCEVTDGTNTAN